MEAPAATTSQVVQVEPQPLLHQYFADCMKKSCYKFHVAKKIKLKLNKKLIVTF